MKCTVKTTAAIAITATLVSPTAVLAWSANTRDSFGQVGAETFCPTLQGKDPWPAMASLYELGTRSKEEKDYKTAISYFDQALKDKQLPHCPGVKNHIVYTQATMLEKVKDFGRAVSMFKELPVTDPARDLGLAECYYNLAQFREAQKYAAEVARRHPSDECSLLQGKIYFRSGEYEKAEKSFSKVTGKPRNDADFMEMERVLKVKRTSSK